MGKIKMSYYKKEKCHFHVGFCFSLAKLEIFDAYTFEKKQIKILSSRRGYIDMIFTGIMGLQLVYLCLLDKLSHDVHVISSFFNFLPNM